jgi:hypothetical protein
MDVRSDRGNDGAISENACDHPGLDPAFIVVPGLTRDPFLSPSVRQRARANFPQITQIIWGGGFR